MPPTPGRRGGGEKGLNGPLGQQSTYSHTGKKETHKNNNKHTNPALEASSGGQGGGPNGAQRSDWGMEPPARRAQRTGDGGRATLTYLPQEDQVACLGSRNQLRSQAPGSMVPAASEGETNRTLPAAPENSRSRAQRSQRYTTHAP